MIRRIRRPRSRSGPEHVGIHAPPSSPDDPDIWNGAQRDPGYHATALGWAHHNHQHAVVTYLLDHADILDAVKHGAVARVAALLAEAPARAQVRDHEGRALVALISDDTPHQDQLRGLLRAHGRGRLISPATRALSGVWPVSGRGRPGAGHSGQVAL